MDQVLDQEQTITCTEPIEPLSVSLERSRIMGDYYRDLATNYQEYDRTKNWPAPPFPPQRHVTVTDIF